MDTNSDALRGDVNRIIDRELTGLIGALKGLQKTGKLLEMRAGQLPCGKEIEGIQSCLRSGEFRNGIQWLSFDLQNDSDRLSIQLAPGGIPREILVDNVPYRWAGPFRGRLPVCRPGQRVADAELKLGKEWLAIKVAGGSGLLELKPGKHTVQGVIYAVDKNAAGRRPTLRVLSNPVEVVIPAREKDDEAAAAAERIKVRLNAPESGALERFLAIEAFARLSKAEQAKGLPKFYKELAHRSINLSSEMLLSSRPHDILNPYQKGDPYDGNTERWAEQLAGAAASMSAEQVADKLKSRMWLNIAARARALHVLKNHPDGTAALLEADLDSRNSP